MTDADPAATDAAYAAFIAEFEAGRLPRARWTHAAHLRAGLWYVSRLPLDEAIATLRRRIRAHNEAVGTPNTDVSGYHETLTALYARGIAAHAAAHPGLSLGQLAERLLASPLARVEWPLGYYSRERLYSVAARREWLEPDLAPAPAPARVPAGARVSPTDAQGRPEAHHVAIEIATTPGPDWLALRLALWPDTPVDDARAEIAALCADPANHFNALARAPSGEAIGLVEAALRHDYVNGTDSSPVAFAEGLYVVPAWRRRGVARALFAAVLAWARSTGCRELASDADLANVASQALHAALGFEETERVVYFRRALDDGRLA